MKIESINGRSFSTQAQCADFIKTIEGQVTIVASAVALPCEPQCDNDKLESARRKNRERMRANQKDDNYKAKERACEKQQRSKRGENQTRSTATPITMRFEPIKEVTVTRRLLGTDADSCLHYKRKKQFFYEDEEDNESEEEDEEEEDCDEEDTDEEEEKEEDNDFKECRSVVAMDTNTRTLQFNIERFTLKNQPLKKALLNLYALESSDEGGNVVTGRNPNLPAAAQGYPHLYYSQATDTVLASIRNIRKHSWVQVDVTELLLAHKETAVDSRGVLTVHIASPGTEERFARVNHRCDINCRYEGQPVAKCSSSTTRWVGTNGCYLGPELWLIS